MIQDLEKSNSVLLVDPEIYSMQAIRNAAYDFSGKMWFDISETSKGKIKIYLSPKKDNILMDVFKKEFLNHILDHQVRLDLNEKFGLIREMIVAQAFEPCDNFEELIREIISE